MDTILPLNTLIPPLNPTQPDPMQIIIPSSGEEEEITKTLTAASSNLNGRWTNEDVCYMGIIGKKWRTM